jgi:hypothetical protein
MKPKLLNMLHIQGDLGGRVNIVGYDSIGNCEKKVYMNTCVIVNGNKERKTTAVYLILFLILCFIDRFVTQK